MGLPWPLPSDHPYALSEEERGVLRAASRGAYWLAGDEPPGFADLHDLAGREMNARG